MDIKKYQKIFVYGDAGRGKTTLSKKIAESLGYSILHLDEVFWEEWLTKKRNEDEQEKIIKKFLDNNDKWLIEGCTRSRHKSFLHEIDLVIYLRYKNFLDQLLSVWKRGLKRGDTFKQLIEFSINLTQKYYKLGRFKNKPTFKESIAEYKGEMVEFSSFKEIDKFVEENL